MEIRSLLGKRGAIELSMTTVVVIVLAMLMLTLGLTLIRTIFAGAQENVVEINDQVRDEINRLFVQDNQRSVVYLSQGSAEIKQGDSFGIGFAIRNTAAAGNFDYRMRLTSKSCARDDPTNWFVFPPSASGIPIQDGGNYYDFVTLKPSENAELCFGKFVLEISKDGQIYDSQPFSIEIKPQGLF